LATKELAAASRQRNVSHFLFHQEVFDQKQHDCHSHLSYFSLFPRLEIKLKDLQLDTTEMIEAESQKVLNILIEHEFQNASKTERRPLNGLYE
jgi:hypothetical protein